MLIVSRVESQLVDRIAAVDWPGVEAALDEQGFAPLPAVLTADECAGLSRLYQDDARFRSRIDMARFRFGSGEYKYFGPPLPDIVRTLRMELYQRLVSVANRWVAGLKARAVGATGAAGQPSLYPPALDAFLANCHKKGQRRPTPLLLSYRAGD